MKTARFGLQPPGTPAPAWTTAEWFNAPAALQLSALRGKVVALHAFGAAEDLVVGAAIAALIGEPG